MGIKLFFKRYEYSCNSSTQKTTNGLKLKATRPLSASPILHEVSLTNIFSTFRPLGQQIKQHDVFGTVEAVKTVSDLYMPISRQAIVEFNKALEAAPEKVNSDAYGKGWMVKISVTNAAELDSLLTANDPNSYSKKSIVHSP